MFDLKLLKTFVAVAKLGSFATAAKHQHVVPSVVAKRIALLELQVGLRLFERTTRKVALTPAGERLQRHAMALLVQADEAWSDVQQEGRGETRGDMRGHVRVMAPTTLTTLHLSDSFSRFLRHHPQLTLDVVLGDRSINPIEEAFDMVISGRLANFDGVQPFPLAPIGYVACAAPAYLAHAAPLPHPNALDQHACLVFEPFGRAWVFQSVRGLVYVDVPPRLVADDNQTVLRACLQGLGVAVLPRYIAESALARGALVPVLPRFTLQAAWFKAYIPKRKAHLPRVLALKDHVREDLIALCGEAG